MVTMKWYRVHVDRRSILFTERNLFDYIPSGMTGLLPIFRLGAGYAYDVTSLIFFDTF